MTVPESLLTKFSTKAGYQPQRRSRRPRPVLPELDRRYGLRAHMDRGYGIALQGAEESDPEYGFVLPPDGKYGFIEREPSSGAARTHTVGRA